jgi:hypothetical protein
MVMGAAGNQQQQALVHKFGLFGRYASRNFSRGMASNGLLIIFNTCNLRAIYGRSNTQLQTYTAISAAVVVVTRHS